MAYDLSHQFPSLLDSREELTRESLEKNTKLVQAGVDSLFSLPSSEYPDGPISHPSGAYHEAAQREASSKVQAPNEVEIVCHDERNKESQER